jgi:pilus assembly protein Flp/PilA
MTKLGAIFVRVRKDESGATMIEYSILIGIITVAAIAGISFMGTWVGEQWTALTESEGIAAPVPAP